MRSREGPQISVYCGQIEYLKDGRACLSISEEQVMSFGLQKVGEFNKKYPSQQYPDIDPWVGSPGTLLELVQ